VLLLGNCFDVDDKPLGDCILRRNNFGLIYELWKDIATVRSKNGNQCANHPEFFGTDLNSDAVSRVPNGSIWDRQMSHIFIVQRSNVNKDPSFRFFCL